VSGSRRGRGVLADAGTVLDAEQRAVAATLACSTAAPVDRLPVAAGRTAARVWRLALVDDDDDPATGAAQHRVDHVVLRPELEALVARRPRHPSSRSLAEALHSADARAESPGETLTRRLLAPVLPGLVPQMPLVGPAGDVVARLDLGDEALRLGVECDGRRGHAGEVMVAEDRWRDARTTGLGWSVERVTRFEVRCRRAQTRARVVATADRLAG
jgi:hypothetical protein